MKPLKEKKVKKKNPKWKVRLIYKGETILDMELKKLQAYATLHGGSMSFICGEFVCYQEKEKSATLGA